MKSATLVGWLRCSSFVLLLLYGGLFVMFGLLSTLLPLVSYGRGPVQVWRYILAGPVATLVGVGTLMRLRLPAVVLSVLLALAGAVEMVGIAHGFGLSNPPHISASEIGCVVIFALLPSVLTTLSWKRLRWLPKPSNQAMQ